MLVADLCQLAGHFVQVSGSLVRMGDDDWMVLPDDSKASVIHWEVRCDPQQCLQFASQLLHIMRMMITGIEFSNHALPRHPRYIDCNVCVVCASSIAIACEGSCINDHVVLPQLLGQISRHETILLLVKTAY